MQEIKKLLEDIKQTGEGSLELKIENIVYERRFYRPERLIILGEVMWGRQSVNLRLRLVFTSL